MGKKLSKVEVKGIEALLYDVIMDVVSGFTYERFMEKVVRDMHIGTKDNILDLGCGTARNMLLMKRYTNSMIVGFDIGDIMLSIAKKKTKLYKNIKIFKHDIRKPYPFINTFDIVFISFVLHGFIDSDRDKIIKNAFVSLKEGGRFCILDYNEFNLHDSSIPVKLAFKYAECPLASEFISIDLKAKLSGFGFSAFETCTYYFNKVRLLIAKK